MASSNVVPIPIRSAPGIQRDGTVFAGESYVDGEWVRFQRGLPRKIGGYRQVVAGLSEVPYGMRADLDGSSVYVHIGSASYLTQVVTDYQGVFSNQFNRTPAGFVPDPYNIWNFDTFVETLGGSLQIVGAAVSTLVDIGNNTEKAIYFGPLNTGAALTQAYAGTALSTPGVSGGVVALWPFFMGYGSAGHVKWSAPNDLVDWNNEQYVSGSKIVKGMPMRGNGNGPAVILWSLTDVIAGQYAGVDPLVPTSHLFNFSTLSTQSSVLSSQGFMDYNGVYYWAGVDCFLMFNGVVSEVPNNQNINWFFDNLNFQQRQKVFAYKVPRFGEIWWCFPFGNATECTHAVIYNVREKTWYDTALPAGLRTAGAFAQSYRFPFMCDATLNTTTTKYTLWQHETGTDEITNVPNAVRAILARIRTNQFSPITQGQDAGFHIARTEPDFIQTGAMQVRVIGQANARAPEVVGETFTFQQPPTADIQDQPVNMKTVQRLMSLEFESNVAGGDFQMGRVLAYVMPQEMRNTGP
jgi:hypothetical protein